MVWFILSRIDLTKMGTVLHLMAMNECSVGLYLRHNNIQVISFNPELENECVTNLYQNIDFILSLEYIQYMWLLILL